MLNSLPLFICLRLGPLFFYITFCLLSLLRFPTKLIHLDLSGRLCELIKFSVCVCVGAEERW